MAPDVPFADLMGRLTDQDPEAAHLVYDRYARRLVGLAAARLPPALAPKLDPEDVVQSVFTSFFAGHAAARFHLQRWDSLWSLLSVLTVRQCGHRLKHFRCARRDMRREAEGAAAPAGPRCWPEPATRGPTPAEAAQRADTLDALFRGLSATQRTIVRLRLAGYTVEEISRQAACAERTAYRVLEKVRARLGDRCPNDEPR
jgi:RNA polymerase sigma-70 factor (ECF subfamily)